MIRRPLLLGVVLALVGVACSEGPREAAEALSPGVPPSPSATETTATVTPSPTGIPAIVVRRPVSGDEVTSPVTIAGTADVFEATVSVHILDAEGLELARGFATATCGTGCRGRYRTKLFFFIRERQAGTIEVYESSAEDGSQLNLVSIPVTLVPGG